MVFVECWSLEREFYCIFFLHTCIWTVENISIQAEAEHEEKYFMALEKKEKMEEKMDSVMEVQVKLFKCKQVCKIY